MDKERRMITSHALTVVQVSYHFYLIQSILSQLSLICNLHIYLVCHWHVVLGEDDLLMANQPPGYEWSVHWLGGWACFTLSQCDQESSLCICSPSALKCEVARSSFPFHLTLFFSFSIFESGLLVRVHIFFLFFSFLSALWMQLSSFSSCSDDTRYPYISEGSAESDHPEYHDQSTPSCMVIPRP